MLPSNSIVVRVLLQIDGTVLLQMNNAAAPTLFDALTLTREMLFQIKTENNISVHKVYSTRDEQRQKKFTNYAEIMR